MRRWSLALLALGLILGSISPVSHAAAPDTNSTKNKGLYISPLRSYLTLNAGESATRSFTVANFTDHPIKIDMSVEKFSVAHYTYDYTFAETDNNWITILEPTIELQPNKSHQVPYRVSIPRDATIGGHYYTLLARSNLSDTGFAGSARVASMLYLTVDGELQRTAQIVSSTLPRFTITPDITYSLTVKNTGNIHYFANFQATVDGLFYHNEPSGVSRLLMPGAPRVIENTTPSPLLPGIYKFTYTFTPDKGNALGGSQYFVYLPPWSWVLGIIIAFVLYRLIRHKKKSTVHSP